MASTASWCALPSLAAADGAELTVISSPLSGGRGTRTITLFNACNATVWPVLRDSKLAITSTYALTPGEQRRSVVHNGWAGTVGARTGCNAGGRHCETGDCSSRTPCYNANVVPYTQARVLLAVLLKPTRHLTTHG